MRLTAADSDANEWMTTGRTYSEQRYSPLDQVNATTVSQLGLAWHAEFDTDRGRLTRAYASLAGTAVNCAVAL